MKNKNRLKLKLLFYVLFWAIPLLRSAMGEEAGFIEKNLQARAALVWDVDQKKESV
ncbi:hypothetical protein [Methylacidiphilum kamchatkense]|uniref:hypothetical protein n=1 Tax=Methylacidiphilum kamchatkense TaxID=431057 RepID=UPI000A46C187|nr:hypothetical protein [Methylacidiphilum kamchatkense]